MNRLIAILLGIAVFFSLITFFLYKRFSKTRTIKYLPSVLCLILGGYYLYLAKTIPSSGFEDLANLLISVMLFTGFASGLITALITEFLSKSKS